MSSEIKENILSTKKKDVCFMRSISVTNGPTELSRLIEMFYILFLFWWWLHKHIQLSKLSEIKHFSAALYYV